MEPPVTSAGLPAASSEPPVASPYKPRGQTSPVLFFIILGIIIAGLLSFIILRPS
jgi:hypothetical protein